ncbi:MAG: hypothetical protein ACJ786_36985 [Catenulispora sp.]
MDGYCESVFTRRSPALAARVVDTLHDLGRPVSANRLLAALGTDAPEATVELVQALVASGRRRDLAIVLGRVLSTDADHQAHFIATWVFSSEGPDVVAGMRAVLRNLIEQRSTNPAALLPMLTSESRADELRAGLLDAMLPDFGKALYGYEILVRTPGCAYVADRLLNAQLEKVVDLAAAVDLALALVAGADIQLSKRLAPKSLAILDQPGHLGPPVLLAVALRVIRGTDTFISLAYEDQQIGELLLDEHVVALVAVLHTRDSTRAGRLLQMVAQYRPIEAVPSTVGALETAGLIDERKALMKALRDRPWRDVRRLARLLEASRPDLATELLKTS